MAEFKAGDRVVKMSGMCAGKYGTVNSVSENGTLNVTFDGERLPRYCDPEKCGAMAANAVSAKAMVSRQGSDWYYAWADGSQNGKEGPFATEEQARLAAKQDGFTLVNSRVANAKFKVGDVVYAEPGKIEGVGGKGVIYDKGRYDDYHVNIGGRSFLLPEWVLRSVNSRAANAVKPVGVYRGCKIAVADHSPDDVTRPGKTFIVEDADGVSVGGFVTSDAAKRWCDQHPSRCANSRAANAVARNADFPIEKFEVGKVYRAPWDRNWLAKVLSRTNSSIKVAIKSVRDKTWHGADEQVTLRINQRKSEEQGAEVAKGWDWEFWADVKA